MSTHQQSSPTSTPITLTKFFTLAPIDRDFQNRGRYGSGNSTLYFEQNGQWIKIEIQKGEYIDGKVLVTCFNNSKYLINNEPDIEMFKSMVYNRWLNWDRKYGTHDQDRIDYEPWGHVSTKALASELNCLPEKDQDDLDSLAGERYSFPEHLYFSEAPWRK